MAGDFPCPVCTDAAAACRAGRVEPNFTILDTDDQLRLLKQVMEAARTDPSDGRRCIDGHYSALEGSRLTPAD